MLRVVMAGSTRQMADQLERRLPGVTVVVTGNGAETLGELGSRDVALLVLNHNLADPAAVEVLGQLRAVPALPPPSAPLPVIYCLEEGPAGNLAEKLVRQLGVNQVLFHPIDVTELARQASALLGLPLRAWGEATNEREQQLQARVAAVWDRLGPATLQRLEALELASGAVLEGSLTPPVRLKAEQEAHKLAGSLGMFGFGAASRFAREIQHLLQGGTLLSEAQTLRYSELVLALRLELERNTSATGSALASLDERPAVLIVDQDAGLEQRLSEEAASRGIRLETARSLPQARQVVFERQPQAVLIDLGCSGDPEEGLALLSELAERKPPVPVMVLTTHDSFTDRVEVARRGGHGFLPKSLSAGEILEAVSELLQRLQARRAQVLATDDDPQVLETLKALLEPRGVQLMALEDPLRFWEALQESSPDLVVLDVDMPHLSGIELCRVLRNDARRAATPVIFLTAYSDPETVHRIFAAGADDFVAKPIVGPELLTRIFNRLERTRLLRSAAETDPLTGVTNRRKSWRALEDFLRLADRHAQPLSLGVINLDDLKPLNNQQGHAKGDEALRKMGQLLQRAFRSEDVVGRWGGGEFVVGMYGLSRYDGVQRLNELFEALRQESLQANAGAEFGFSAGVAQYPQDAGDLQGLYRAAEEARRQAKQREGNRVLPAGWSPQEREKLTHVEVALAMADEAEACLLIHALEGRGYRVRWLRDGQVAVQMLGGRPAALQAKVIVLDVDLAGLDGLSLLKRLAWDGVLERSRAIALTARSVGDDTVMALQLGASDHVAKPFSLPVLVRHICRAVEESEASEARRAGGTDVRSPEASPFTV